MVTPIIVRNNQASLRTRNGDNLRQSSLQRLFDLEDLEDPGQMSEAQDSQYSQDQQRSPIGTRNREQEIPETGRDVSMDEDRTEQTEPGARRH